MNFIHRPYRERLGEGEGPFSPTDNSQQPKAALATVHRKCLTRPHVQGYDDPTRSELASPFNLRRLRMALFSTAVVALCFAWFIASSLWTCPHSLSHFNEIIGGPLRGSKHLLGSNLDWGQDLRYAQNWIEKHDQTRVSFFYYGSKSGGTILEKEDAKYSLISLHTLSHAGAREGPLKVTRLRSEPTQNIKLFDSHNKSRRLIPFEEFCK